MIFRRVHEPPSRDDLSVARVGVGLEHFTCQRGDLRRSQDIAKQPIRREDHGEIVGAPWIRADLWKRRHHLRAHRQRPPVAPPSNLEPQVPEGPSHGQIVLAYKDVAVLSLCTCPPDTRHLVRTECIVRRMILGEIQEGIGARRVLHEDGSTVTSVGKRQMVWSDYTCETRSTSIRLSRRPVGSPAQEGGIRPEIGILECQEEVRKVLTLQHVAMQVISTVILMYGADGGS